MKDSICVGTQLCQHGIMNMTKCVVMSPWIQYIFIIWSLSWEQNWQFLWALSAVRPRTHWCQQPTSGLFSWKINLDFLRITEDCNQQVLIISGNDSLIRRFLIINKKTLVRKREKLEKQELSSIYHSCQFKFV